VAPSTSTLPSTKYNPRFYINQGNTSTNGIVLRNGLVWTGTEFKKQDVYFAQGVIRPLSDIHAQEATVVDVEGLFITPGLVDMHSHVGLDSMPSFNGRDDTNEMSTTPVMPYLKSIDAFK
jgi:imidazolonepropionase-like amidohydrolase